MRGNQRTAGELSRKEGGKIFGSGSRAPIAISLLVKNPLAAQQGQIRFHDIGDYLSKDEKLANIAALGSIAGITAAGGWHAIVPDSHGDWLKQRDDSFIEHIALGNKKGAGPTLFENFSLGVVTNRDAWCYNSSKTNVAANMTRMIAFYNKEAQRFDEKHPKADKKQRESFVDAFVDTDTTQIAWTVNLKQELVRNRRFTMDAACLVQGLYRPFNKQWMYFNRSFNERVLQMPRLFPDASSPNIVIGVSASASRSAYSVFISDHVTSLHAVDMVGSQYFPLYLYGDSNPGVAARPKQAALFGVEDQPAQTSQTKRRDAITAEGLEHFQSAYASENINREDIFYYVYGLLHSPDYRERFIDNLGKELPRIPRVKSAADFWSFSQAGRELAELHLNYDHAEPYPLKMDSGGKKLTDTDYRVEKMRYGKNGKDKDLTTLHYNDRITLTGIPVEAYDYVVNGKPALDWVVERQGVKTDKESGIVNDANDWAVETIGNPRYPLELFQRVITVSLETMKIVRSLPKLDIASTSN